jgi:hypothetical protein
VALAGLVKSNLFTFAPIRIISDSSIGETILSLSSFTTKEAP